MKRLVQIVISSNSKFQVSKVIKKKKKRKNNQKLTQIELRK